MIDIVSGKACAIFGLGRAGRAAMEMLYKAGATLYAWDDTFDSGGKQPESMAGITLAAPSSWPWKDIEALVLSPGVPLTHPAPHMVVQLAKEAGCPIICDVELLFASNPDTTYVGITGTNGKSTTTALIGHVAKQVGLQVEVGGNIGMAAASLPSLGKEGVYVLELSSYQLDMLQETTFDVAVLLNLTPDHLDRHGDMEGYIKAKMHIFDRQNADDVAIIAIDDPHTKRVFEMVRQSSTVNLVAVSGETLLEEGVSVKDGMIFDRLFQGDHKEIPIGQPKMLLGQHNQQNIAAAYTAARVMGLSAKEAVDAVRSFPGLAHRLQYIDQIEGLTFINDSKATNAVATRQALRSFEDVFWIAGGVQKDGGIASLSDQFSRVSRVFLIGEAQDSFADTLEGRIVYDKSETLEMAFEQAVDSAKQARAAGAKPVILLSPACASFDQFKNFEERGEVFCTLVEHFKLQQLEAVS